MGKRESQTIGPQAAGGFDFEHGHQAWASEPQDLAFRGKVLALCCSSRTDACIVKLGLRGLVLALYFMVSGGPFGLEELLSKVGFWGAVPFLMITPLIWSLPTALMVGELSAALPKSGGYYAWVKRGLGPFWGFQEAWWSFAASLFDMAIYPSIFTSYLARLWPAAAQQPVLIGVLFVALCLLWNLRGLAALENGGTVLALVLLAPFVILACSNLAFASASPVRLQVSESTAPRDVLGALMIAMWNFMGWDNASTLASEVRSPQKTYPRGVAVALLLVVCTYLVPVVAAACTREDPSAWTTGAWITHAAKTVSPGLSTAICVAGMVSPIGMFASLMASYARLPVALAEDGYLPKAFERRDARGAPYVSLVFCAVLWTATLGLSFERLVVVDVMLYGASLMLEFVALVVLRIREPELERPYKVPGGLIGAIALGVGPFVLLALSLIRNSSERVFQMPAVVFSLLVALAGLALYVLADRHPKRC
jgi:amino acid transporter